MACVARAHGPVVLTLDRTQAAKVTDGTPATAHDASVQRLVILGHGIAGVTAADYARRRHPDCEIHLIGRESHTLYNRMAISRLIYGRSAMQGLYLQPESWFGEHRIETWLNTQAAELDPASRQVRLATGESLNYDRLILATGSRSRLPDIAGIERAGAFVLREADDAIALRAYAQRRAVRQAVVAGGGLLGLEAAYAIHKLGVTVTVLERGPWLLRRQLDARCAELLQRYLEGLGIRVWLEAETAALDGAERVREVVLQDGRRLPCELFLAAAGVQPNIELAQAAGLRVNQGVIVDAYLRTSQPDIYAVGDVCEYDGQVPGLWPVAVEQGKVAALNAVGGREHYAPSTPVTALKVAGINLTSMGRFTPQSDAEVEIVLEEAAGSRYRKLLVADGRIAGAILLGYPVEAAAVARIVKAGGDVSAQMEALRTGRWEGLAVPA
jgi:NAD(P)H-nitrite reductase large subunit